MIFNIRGTSGSGKSHIIHSILSMFENHEITLDGKPIAYNVPKLQANIIGRYGTQCGGCDGIKTQDLVCGRVIKFKKPNLIFEGLLISHSFQRYHELALEHGPIIFCFLDTTPDDCIDRVYKRRELKGMFGTFNEDQIYKDHAAVMRCKQKFANAGHTVYELESKNSVNDFIEVYTEHMEVS